MIVDLMRILIRKVERAARTLYDHHSIHVILFTVARGLRRVLLQTGIKLIALALVGKLITGIHVFGIDPAVWESPAEIRLCLCGHEWIHNAESGTDRN